MKTTVAVVAKTLREKNATAREIALRELKILQKDLGLLEKILTGGRKAGDFSLFDVVHGAFEIFRNASVVLDNELLLADLEKETVKTASLEFLERHGATLLTKPAGWHWISPKGEMRFLGKGTETEKAAEALRQLVPGGRRAKTRPAEPALAPDTPATSETAGTA
ncbi:hypothetical protein [Desulfolutivibrio sulfoxidireducens]|uniref:hypothetical protein n=1 Tax=Desulfolutivibrio sulfoxidireducens TaxID=2773299 RepID=UPI00159D298A|nr:hypothetical protein [Desulfolutivibrio sulfoxidireducens]